MAGKENAQVENIKRMLVSLIQDFRVMALFAERVLACATPNTTMKSVWAHAQEAASILRRWPTAWECGSSSGA